MPGFPIVPSVYLLAGILILVLGFLQSPGPSLSALLTVAAVLETCDMKPVDRHKWIDQWLEARTTSVPMRVDVLNRAFVDAYVAATGAKFVGTNWGADHCKQLGRDLAAMERMGQLKRRRVGLSDGAWMPGFPKWVWSYARAT